MESTPVCGVDIKKETVAPLLAPFLLNEIPVGITPQEHKGSGMPKTAALITELRFLRPKYLATLCFGK